MNLSDINIHDIGNEITIAGTLWSGKGKIFATLIPGKKEDLSSLKLMDLSLEEWQKLLRQSDIVETEMFLRDKTGITKTLFRKSQRTIDSYIAWKVFQRDSYHCRYCHRTGIPLTVDHCDLYELGGATIIENLLSACKSCNKDRGRTPYAEWMESLTYRQKRKNLPLEIHLKNVALIKQLESLKKQRVTNIRKR